MTLRAATEGDLPAVRALLARAALPLDGLGDQFGPGFVVATEDGAVVGAAGVERYGDYGLLRSVVVEPGRRSRGLGEALTRDRLRWARREGLAAVYLLTTTAGDYFRRLGFEPLDRPAVPAAVRASKEFAGACPASALAMCHRIEVGR